VSSKSVQIIGGEDREHAWVDSKHNALVTVDEIHAVIHKGGLYTASAVALVIGGATAEFLVRVNSGAAHMRFLGTVAHQMLADLYESPTTTADGIAIPCKNRNRFTGGLCTTEIFAGPTVTADGDVLMNFFIPGGDKQTASGGQGSSFEEWILSPGDYLVRISNTIISPASDGYAGMAFDFYE